MVTSEIKILQWRGREGGGVGGGALPEENIASEKSPPDCTLHPACNSRNTENEKMLNLKNEEKGGKGGRKIWLKIRRGKECQIKYFPSWTGGVGGGEKEGA